MFELGSLLDRRPKQLSGGQRQRVRAGDQVEVVVDTERMHFFDPETGNTIRD
jgi:multiple sugar transport system ATP-binding protein